MKHLRIRSPEDLFSLTPSHPVETIANLDKIPIRENHEALVDLRTACPDLIIRPLTARKILRARASVAQRLNLAQAHLQQYAPGHCIMVVDGWRSLSQQRFWHHLAKAFFRLRHPFWSVALVREAANKYVAATDCLAPPPHNTGGAVDVRLCDSAGKIVSMGPRTSAACRTAYEKLSLVQRKNRDLLCNALESAGFSNYEEEWWHWSYGDSGWALRCNEAFACYGQCGN